MCVAHFPKEILHCLILWQAVICNFIFIQITSVWLKNWFFYQKNIKATFLLKKKKEDTQEQNGGGLHFPLKYLCI